MKLFFNFALCALLSGAFAGSGTGAFAQDDTETAKVADPAEEAAPKPKPYKKPKPFPEFDAKRIKAPKKTSTRKRITVQIEPEAPVQPAATASDAQPSQPSTASYAWFWDKVSPKLGQANAGRIEHALNALASSNSKVRAPRLQHLQDIAKVHGVDILTSTIGTEVSPALVLAVIAVESAGKADAQSHAGAQGLMQLMPATAARFGVKDSFSAKQNITGGVKYLDWLMKEFDRDPILALAGYNAGEGAVRKHDGVPPFAETRDYVPKALAAFQVAKGLCLTAPELASDGCVFAAMN